MKNSRKPYLVLVIILVGLAGRSALDKVLAQSGGGELVARWAQMSSVIELVTAVTAAGVGTGLTVLVAQTSRTADRLALLRYSLKFGSAASAAIALALILFNACFSPSVFDFGIPDTLVVLGAAIGWASILPSLLCSYWLGLRRYGWLAGMTALLALVPLGAAMVANRAYILETIAISLFLPIVASLLILVRDRNIPDNDAPDAGLRRSLLRFLSPGLTTGILSPVSMLAARSIVSAEMSWSDAGMLQAILRVSDWVSVITGGFLAVYFLPRLSAFAGTPRFGAEIRIAAIAAIMPSAVAFAVLFHAHRDVFSVLYDDSFVLSDVSVALFLGGSLLRIAAWVPLQALYARGQAAAINVGEFLSLPMFAFIVWWFSDGLTLERVGVIWFVSYAVYGLFNFWALAAFQSRR